MNLRHFLAVASAGFVLSACLIAQSAPNGTVLHHEPYRTTLSYKDWFDRVWLNAPPDPPDRAPDLPTVRSYFSPDTYESLSGQADVTVNRIEYLSDGLHIRGFQVEPKSRKKRLPVIIWCRGGLGDIGMINTGDLMIMSNWARRGYIVLASNYRGSRGSEGKDEDGGADVHDVLSLIATANAIPEAETENIFLYGESRGGMMVYESMAVSRDIRAAVVNSGVADMAPNYPPRPDQKEMDELTRAAIPDFDTEKLTGFTSRSAVQWAEKLGAPILILHGTDDWRVSPRQALRMAQALQAAGREYDLIMFAHGVHVSLTGRQQEMDDIILKFFDRKRLRKR